MPNCDFNKVDTLWHGCSPVNLLQIFRTYFTKNNSGRLLVTHKSQINSLVILRGAGLSGSAKIAFIFWSDTYPKRLKGLTSQEMLIDQFH